MGKKAKDAKNAQLAADPADQQKSFEGPSSSSTISASSQPTVVNLAQVPDASPDSFRKFIKYATYATPESFPTLPTYVFFTRVFLGVLYGTLLGVRNVRGAQTLFSGFIMVFMVPQTFLERWSKINDEKWGGNLVFAGVLPAVACMLLVWIWLFNAMHTNGVEEEVLNYAIRAGVRVVSEDLMGEAGGFDAAAGTSGGEAAGGGADSVPVAASSTEEF